MKKLFKLFAVITTMCVIACSDKGNLEKGGIKIDANLSELGGLNLLLMQYDDAGDMIDDCIAVKLGKKWGLINLRGDTILGFQYDKIEKIYKEDFWQLSIKDIEASREALKKGYYTDGYYDVGIANSKGKVIIPPKAGNRTCRTFGNDMFITRDGGLRPTIYDANGEELLFSYGEYDAYVKDVKYWKEKYGVALCEDDMWYVYRDFVLDSVGYYDAKPTPTVCYVKNGEGKWGAIDTEYNEVVPFVYSNIHLTDYDFVLVVNEEGKWARSDKNGVGSFYNYISVDNGYSVAYDGDAKLRIIFNEQGKELFRTEETVSPSFYRGGYFKGTQSVFDKKGNVIAKVADTLTIKDYANGFLVVSTPSNKSGILTVKGETVLPLEENVVIEKEKESMVFRITRILSDEEVNGKHKTEYETDIFDTEKRTAIHTDMPISSFNQKGFALAEIFGRHLYVNTEGKFGFENFEEIKSMLLAQHQERMEKAEAEDMKHAKELIERRLRSSGWNIHSLYSVEKNEDDTFSASFTVMGKYVESYYNVTGIIIENDEVVEFYAKLVGGKPREDAPPLPRSIDDIINSKIGVIGY